MNTESIWSVRACRQTAMHAGVLISLMRTDVTTMNTQTSPSMRSHAQWDGTESDSRARQQGGDDDLGNALRSLNLVPIPWPFLDGTESPSVTLFSSFSLLPSPLSSSPFYSVLSVKWPSLHLFRGLVLGLPVLLLLLFPPLQLCPLRSSVPLRPSRAQLRPATAGGNGKSGGNEDE